MGGIREEEIRENGEVRRNGGVGKVEKKGREGGGHEEEGRKVRGKEKRGKKGRKDIN